MQTASDKALPTTPADALIPLTVLFGNPQCLSPAISPDGRCVAWLAPDDGVLNVFVRDLDGAPGSEVPVTCDRDRGIHAFAWGPDAARILYLQDDAGNENWGLHDVRLDTGVERELTPGKDSQTRILKISKRYPGEILLSINLDRPHLHDVYTLNLDSGELTKVYENPGFIAFVADEEFAIRGALAPTPDAGTAILVRNTEESPWRPLLTVDQQDALSTQPIAFSVDGTRLLCITSEGANAAQLVWFDIATGERTTVAGDDTFDVATAALHIDTNEPRVVFFQRDRLEPVVVDPTIAEDISQLTALGGDLQLLGSDHHDRIWLVATIHDDGPIRYYTHRRGSGDPQFLFAHRPELDQHTLAPMEPFAIEAREDDMTLHGYLTFPTDRPRLDLPAVLLVHGGPWHRDTWGFDPQVQWLANRGYLVIQVNFRGSTGYGKRHLNAGNREWGAKMHDDLLDVMTWTIGQRWADPNRIAIFGASYGGYAALVGAAFTPHTFRCAVAVAAPANLNTLITSYPPYWAPVIAQAHLRVGNPDTDRDFLWSRSPLSRVGDIHIPLMIVQGANDPRVPQAESEQIVNALRISDVPLSYLLFGDEGHGLVKPDNRLRFYAAAEHFLAQHLGGHAEPTTDDTGQATSTG